MKPGGHLTLRPAVSLAALTLVLTLALGPGTAYAQFCPSPFEEEAIARINQERQGLGLDPVETDLRLVEASRLHSQDMATNDYFEHSSRDGRGPADRAQAAGHPSRFIGENIAAGGATPEATMRQWLDSPGHCMNLLSHEYTLLGVGHAVTPSGRLHHYWTQVFGD
jgi:uncharacterized protein YkwD